MNKKRNVHYSYEALIWVTFLGIMFYSSTYLFELLFAGKGKRSPHFARRALFFVNGNVCGVGFHNLFSTGNAGHCLELCLDCHRAGRHGHLVS